MVKALEREFKYKRFLIHCMLNDDDHKSLAYICNLLWQSKCGGCHVDRMNDNSFLTALIFIERAYKMSIKFDMLHCLISAAEYSCCIINIIIEN